MEEKTSVQFSTLNEKALHASLKEWYAQPGDLFEVSVDGSIIDIRRGELLIEIQTRSFPAIRRKLTKLCQNHPVRLVYPIARNKWITRIEEDGSQLSRRKSPKRGDLQDLFHELVTMPYLCLNPNFSIEVLFIEEEETRQHTDYGNWRRKGWATVERRLLKVVERQLFQSPADFASLIPADLAEPFTVKELAEAIEKPPFQVQRMVYCLRGMGCIQQSGKRSRAYLYRRVKAPAKRKKKRTAKAG